VPAALVITTILWASAFAGIRAGLGEVPKILSVAGGVVTLAGVLLVNVLGRGR
jgi:hypothetical protein